MHRMRRSERELRETLIRTVRESRPAASVEEVEGVVDRFLAFDDPHDELPIVWRHRWRADREAQRNGR